MLDSRLSAAARDSALKTRVAWPGLLLAWQSPRWSAALAGAVYLAICLWHQFPPGASNYPYYNYLADAFLHGQLHLRLLPANVGDLVALDGHYYLYWPPLPAVLLMPFVAIFGVGFSDQLFTVALGALNVALVALLVRRADERLALGLSPAQRSLLVLFFALGSVHFPLAGRGRVWETAQLLAFACLALAYLAALSFKGPRAFVLAGLGVAAAALARNNVVLVGLWPAWYLLWSQRERGPRYLLRCTAFGLLPFLGAGLLFGAYNWLRFGSVLDVGLSHHLMAPLFRDDYVQFGAFSLHYLPTNLYYQLLHLPFFGNPLMGGSLFLMSPVWFSIFWAARQRRLRANALALGLTVLLAEVPILLLMGTGWMQFGSRYTLDFTVPLLLLAAQGVRYWPFRAQWLLTAVSIGLFSAGAILLAMFLG